MSQSLRRGLALLETVDIFGPLTVADLTRRLGWDKASVSRTAASCVADGWLVRDGSLLRLGPRAALLGRAGETNTAARDAEVLVHTVSGVTGLPTHAYVLSGDRGVVMAGATPPGMDMPPFRSVRMPLWASATSKVIASQLEPEELQALLPEDPLPDVHDLSDWIATSDLQDFVDSVPTWTRLPDTEEDTTRVTTRADLAAQLAQIRTTGVFIEHREIAPNGACLAVPWQRPGIRAALACIATVADIDGNRDLIERTLRAAAAPGATRDSVVQAAAQS